MLSNAKIAVCIAVITTITGCSLFRPRTPVVIVPVQTIAVAEFACSCDEATKKSVQDVIIDRLFKNTMGRVVRGDVGDIVIRGSIIMTTGTSVQTSLKSFFSFSPAQNRSEGAYVSGMTAQAYKGGAMIASSKIGQDLGNGELISPVKLADGISEELAGYLVDLNEVNER